MKTITASIGLKIGIREVSDGVYSAFCEELGLATCGSTFEEAEKRIDKSIRLVLDTATKKNEIEELLREKNICLCFEANETETVAMRPLKAMTLRLDEWIKPYIHRVKVPAG